MTQWELRAKIRAGKCNFKVITGCCVEEKTMLSGLQPQKRLPQFNVHEQIMTESIPMVKFSSDRYLVFPFPIQKRKYMSKSKDMTAPRPLVSFILAMAHTGFLGAMVKFSSDRYLVFFFPHSKKKIHVQKQRHDCTKTLGFLHTGYGPYRLCLIDLSTILGRKNHRCMIALGSWKLYNTRTKHLKENAYYRSPT